MKTSEVISAWRKILQGEPPSLSIEITRECPLRCPGCYAYDDAHLGGGLTLLALTLLNGPGSAVSSGRQRVSAMAVGDGFVVIDGWVLPASYFRE